MASVARQLGYYVGRTITKYDVLDIARDLGIALALEPDHEGLGDVVFAYRDELVTPELCRSLAEAAIGALWS